MKHALALLLLVPLTAFAAPKCWEGDGTKKLNEKERMLVAATEGEWMKDMIYCDFGAYQIARPRDPKSDVIVVLRRGRPFMSHEPGFGINLHQDMGEAKAVPYLTVQPDETGLFRRLDYVLVDPSGKTIGFVKDKAMTGDAVVTRYSSDTPKR